MATFTVKRSEWYRGKGSERSRLLRKDGLKCCIGFVGQQCGIDNSKLSNKITVQSVIHRFPETASQWPEWMQLQPALDCARKAYTINDNSHLSDTMRELCLKELFKEHRDEIVFVD